MSQSQLNNWYRANSDQRTHEFMGNSACVAFFPGAGQLRFERALQPLGTAIAVCLSYGETQVGSRTYNTRPVVGLTGKMVNGKLVYGHEYAEFVYDLCRRPVAGSKGTVMDIERHAGLITRAIAMDYAAKAACHKSARTGKDLPTTLVFPTALAGFDTPPDYADTQELRALAAERMGCNVDALETQMFQMDDYLPRLWADLVIPPGEGVNWTNQYLMPVSLFPNHDGPVFEDFSELLGRKVANPVASLLNPAKWAAQQVNAVHRDMTQADDRLVGEMLKAMRHRLGREASAQFTDEHLMDAMLHQDSQLVNDDDSNVIELIGLEAFAQLVRSRLPEDISELATDGDIAEAISNPAEQLVLSGVVMPQVLDMSSTRVFSNDGIDYTMVNSFAVANFSCRSIRPRTHATSGGRRRVASPPRQAAQPDAALA